MMYNKVVIKWGFECDTNYHLQQWIKSLLENCRSDSATASPGVLGLWGASETLVRIFLVVVETDDLLTAIVFVSQVGVTTDGLWKANFMNGD